MAGASKFPGGLKESHSVAQTMLVRVVTPELQDEIVLHEVVQLLFGMWAGDGSGNFQMIKTLPFGC